MHTALYVILATLIPLLTGGLIAAALNPNRTDDLLKRAVGDAPYFPRGGYAAMDERAPIEAERAP